jgi:hypothetical protein
MPGNSADGRASGRRDNRKYQREELRAQCQETAPMEEHLDVRIPRDDIAGENIYFRAFRSGLIET